MSREDDFQETASSTVGRPHSKAYESVFLGRSGWDTLTSTPSQSSQYTSAPFELSQDLSRGAEDNAQHLPAYSAAAPAVAKDVNHPQIFHRFVLNAETSTASSYDAGMSPGSTESRSEVEPSPFVSARHDMVTRRSQYPIFSELSLGTGAIVPITDCQEAPLVSRLETRALVQLSAVADLAGPKVVQNSRNPEFAPQWTRISQVPFPDNPNLEAYVWTQRGPGYDATKDPENQAVECYSPRDFAAPWLAFTAVEKSLDGSSVPMRALIEIIRLDGHEVPCSKANCWHTKTFGKDHNGKAVPVRVSCSGIYILHFRIKLTNHSFSPDYNAYVQLATSLSFTQKLSRKTKTSATRRDNNDAKRKISQISPNSLPRESQSQFKVKFKPRNPAQTLDQENAWSAVEEISDDGDDFQPSCVPVPKKAKR